MHRFLLAALLTATTASAAAAQQLFVAPTANSVRASTEQSGGSDQVHLLTVTNQSSVPIVVFGTLLTDCDNVKQWCGGNRTNYVIEPGQRTTVGRVQPKSTERAFSYRWNFSYRADSSDARVRAILREHGLLPPERAYAEAGPVTPVRDPAVATESATPSGTESTPAADSAASVAPAPVPPTPARSTALPRFKVHYGSILGSTMMKNAPIQRLGPCTDPAESAQHERDATITRTPWRPAVVDPNLSSHLVPVAIPDSIAPKGDVLVRWVADTAGATIPASVRVLESPHPLMSVRACTVIMGLRVTPARGQSGKPIRSWLQMPLTIEATPAGRPDTR